MPLRICVQSLPFVVAYHHSFSKTQLLHLCSADAVIAPAPLTAFTTISSFAYLGHGIRRPRNPSMKSAMSCFRFTRAPLRWNGSSAVVVITSFLHSQFAVENRLCRLIRWTG